MITCSFKPIFKDKNKVMFVFSHPDDAEIYAGGTIARLVEEGKEVRVVKMTLGNKGSRQEKITEQELATIRKVEDTASMEILGIEPKNNVYLDFKDGEITDSLETIEALVKQIREFKPDLIVTHNPENTFIRFDKNVNWVNHRDHRNTGRITIDAAYPYSRDILFFPQHFAEENMESHAVKEFLLVDYYDHADTINIDITDTVKKRNEALSKHESQYTLEDAQEATEFFTKLDGTDNRYERFRHVVAD